MKEIIIIDLETTGFLRKNGKIVEVGIVSLDLDTGDTKMLYNKVVREKAMTQQEIEAAWIIQNSDLTVKEVMQSNLLENEIIDIQEIIDQYPNGATAYNRNFDIDFLESRGIKFGKKLDCPMILSTPICKLKGRYRGFKWPTAEEAYNYFYPNSNFIEKHRGGDDALHEAKIVLALHKLGKYKI